METAILEATGISYRNGDGEPVLSGLDFSVGAGESVCFFDRQEITEALLLQIFATIETPGEGALELFGQKVDCEDYPALGKLRMKVGYTALDSTLISNLTVYDNLALIWRYHYKLKKTELEEKIIPILESFQIAQYKDLRPSRVDREVRKRAVYAREFIKEPKLLIIDRPTMDLSHKGRLILIEAIKRFMAEPDRAVVLNSNHRDFISAVADRLVFLKEGKIIHSVDREKLIDIEGDLAKLVD
jgi:ABC-type multidrug transport system ATPase subunit